MKKLKLEEIEVESYETSKEDAPRGTIRAHGEPYTQQGSCTCALHLCTAPETCAYTCYLIETCDPNVCF